MLSNARFKEVREEITKPLKQSNTEGKSISTFYRDTETLNLTLNIAGHLMGALEGDWKEENK